jgi:hypothetical protein
MEVVSFDLERAELLGRDLLARWITTPIETCADDEATTVGRVPPLRGLQRLDFALSVADVQCG